MKNYYISERNFNGIKINIKYVTNIDKNRSKRNASKSLYKKIKNMFKTS